MRTRPLTLVVYLLLVGGCQPSPPPEPPVALPAEDLSHWTVPTLVQPPSRKPLPRPRRRGLGPRPRKSMSMSPGRSIK